jgi:murein DD-endopeptidase MepM/ murein hydrolase activator NlpD
MKNFLRNSLHSFYRLFLGILLISLCFSCSQKPAKVLNRGKNTYSKNSNITKNSQAENKQKNRQVEVTNGDTVYSVSKKYQTSPRDLIKQNDLSAPYNLKAGTKIIIPNATYHEVQKGETLYAVSRIYNMKISDIIEMNDLKEPYSVKAGQKLKVSAATKETVAETSKTSVKTPEKIPEKQPETKVIANKEEKKPEENLSEKIVDKSNHFAWPMRGAIISRFGPKKGGLYNDGINIKAKEGAVVKSAEDGVVAYVGNELKGYGNLVIVKHSSGWITAYAHLANSAVVRGQKVVKGTKIGTVGSSGNVNSPQLYFGLRKGRDAVNPENYLK